jgi:hypothetical protein
MLLRHDVLRTNSKQAKDKPGAYAPQLSPVMMGDAIASPKEDHGISSFEQTLAGG